MASASAADTWRDSGVRGQRPLAGAPAPRPDLPRHDATPARASRMSLPPVPPPHPRGRPGGSGHGAGTGHGRPVPDSRPPAIRPGQRPPQPGPPPVAGRDGTQAPPRHSRPVERVPARDAGRNAVPGRGSRGSSRRTPPDGRRDTGLRGVLAVLGVFVITLAGGAVDSFLAVGLGTLTLVTLVAATAVGTLLVRPRDLLTVVCCPPLVFVAVAAVNIGLAPSASFTLPTLATILIRGFPTMAVATGVAVVLAVVRWAAKR
ncbi:hypothetical protein SAMN04488107_2785 [Geodermatophilus saharensis]|uniref:DUF6542 domain-containing protein n=1 Tax=Geodermatophilus saharensis TaxID=1137994 RepID=A0A239F2P9_9ACTN|nr:DUF6542 domain-containing protein [Geodermatophilus saharensis]SNS50553.1 hypothetical protein SAMN04488107_2785 [Geodermatophilus saharensis]